VRQSEPGGVKAKAREVVEATDVPLGEHAGGVWSHCRRMLPRSVECARGRELVRADARDGPGRLAELGRKRGGGPVSPKFHFSFLNQILDFQNYFKFEFLKMKKTFSRVDPKTKVVQNLILYNFA
jgi:hypothetical protein